MSLIVQFAEKNVLNRLDSLSVVSHGRTLAFSSASLLDEEAVRLAKGGLGQSRRVCVSDAAGTFVVTGLGEGDHALSILDSHRSQ